MRTALWRVAAICGVGMLSLLTQCSNGSTASPTPAPPASIPERLYVVSFMTGHLGVANTALSGFSIDTFSGALTQVAGSPFSNSQATGQVITDPSGNYLVASSPGATMSIYRIDQTTGSLSLTYQSPPKLLPLFTSGLAAFSSNGQFLYVSDNSSSPAITIFSFNSSNGTVSQIGQPVIPPPEMTFINSLTMNPARNALVVGGPTLAAYSVGSAGDLTLEGSPSPASNDGYFAVAVAPAGNFVYASEGNDIRVFSIAASGAIGAEVPGSPFGSQGGDPLVVDPNGRLGFACGQQTTPFSIDPTTGAIMFESNSIPATVVAFDPQGRFLYAVPNGLFSQTLLGYTVDPTTGALTPFVPTDQSLPQYPGGFATTSSN